MTESMYQVELDGIEYQEDFYVFQEIHEIEKPVKLKKTRYLRKLGPHGYEWESQGDHFAVYGDSLVMVSIFYVLTFDFKMLCVCVYAYVRVYAYKNENTYMCFHFCYSQ